MDKEEKIFYNGQKFSKYEDIEKARNRYQAENNCKLSVTHSKLLKTLYGNDNPNINYKLVYNELYYKCSMLNPDDNIVNNQQKTEDAIECPFKIIIRTTKSKKKLKVTQIGSQHIHDRAELLQMKQAALKECKDAKMETNEERYLDNLLDEIEENIINSKKINTPKRNLEIVKRRIEKIEKILLKREINKSHDSSNKKNESSARAQQHESSKQLIESDDDISAFQIKGKGIHKFDKTVKSPKNNKSSIKGSALKAENDKSFLALNNSIDEIDTLLVQYEKLHGLNKKKKLLKQTTDQPSTSKTIKRIQRDVSSSSSSTDTNENLHALQTEDKNIRRSNTKAISIKHKAHLSPMSRASLRIQPLKSPVQLSDSDDMSSFRMKKTIAVQFRKKSPKKITSVNKTTSKGESNELPQSSDNSDETNDLLLVKYNRIHRLGKKTKSLERPIDQLLTTKTFKRAQQDKSSGSFGSLPENICELKKGEKIIDKSGIKVKSPKKTKNQSPAGNMTKRTQQDEFSSSTDVNENLTEDKGTRRFNAKAISIKHKAHLSPMSGASPRIQPLKSPVQLSDSDDMSSFQVKITSECKTTLKVKQNELNKNDISLPVKNKKIHRLVEKTKSPNPSINKSSAGETFKRTRHSKSPAKCSGSDENIDTFRVKDGNNHEFHEKTKSFKRNQSSTLNENIDLIKFKKRNARGRPKGSVTSVIGLPISNDNKPRKFSFMNQGEKIKMALEWVMNDPHVIQNVLNGEYKISTNDIDDVPQLDDSLASKDFDVKLLQVYCNPDAYELLKKKICKKKTSTKWTCKTCKKNLKHLSIQCDRCLKWYDWECEGITEDIKGTWFCHFCNTKKNK